VYAAMVMSYVKKLIETSVKRVYIKQRFIVKPPGAVLTTVNKNSIAEISFGNPEVFLTIFLGVLDLRDLSFEFFIGGNPHPAVSDFKRIGERAFPSIGSFHRLRPRSPYETVRTRLSAGDILLFVTDGIVDARRGELRYGIERLRDEALRILGDGSELDTEEILASVRCFLDGGILEDDMCLLSLSLDSTSDPVSRYRSERLWIINGIRRLHDTENCCLGNEVVLTNLNPISAPEEVRTEFQKYLDEVSKGQFKIITWIFPISRRCCRPVGKILMFRKKTLEQDLVFQIRGVQ